MYSSNFKKSSRRHEGDVKGCFPHGNDININRLEVSPCSKRAINQPAWKWDNGRLDSNLKEYLPRRNNASINKFDESKNSARTFSKPTSAKRREARVGNKQVDPFENLEKEILSLPF
jgi:hypothetical protein